MRGQWLVGMAGLLVGLVACEGKHREFVSGPLPGGDGGLNSSMSGETSSSNGRGSGNLAKGSRMPR